MPLYPQPVSSYAGCSLPDCCVKRIAMAPYVRTSTRDYNPVPIGVWPPIHGPEQPNHRHRLFFACACLHQTRAVVLRSLKPLETWYFRSAVLIRWHSNHIVFSLQTALFGNAPNHWPAIMLQMFRCSHQCSSWKDKCTSTKLVCSH